LGFGGEEAAIAIGRAHTPNSEETLALLYDLRRELGSMRWVSAELGLDERTVLRWVYHERCPRRPARRLIWSMWSLVFNPENLLFWAEELDERRRVVQERRRKMA
jgi:hypothetical protein